MMDWSTKASFDIISKIFHLAPRLRMLTLFLSTSTLPPESFIHKAEHAGLKHLELRYLHLKDLKKVRDAARLSNWIHVTVCK